MAFETERRIAELISRYVTGIITAEEREELDTWRIARPANEKIFDRMLSRDGFETNVRKFVKSGRQDAKEWRRIERRGPGHKRVRRRIALRYTAAIAVLALSAGAYYTLKDKANETAAIAENNIVRAESVPVLLLGDGRQFAITAEIVLAPDGEDRFSVNPEDMALIYNEDKGNFKPATHSLLVPKGSDHKVVLSDNTVVYLNAESSLTYPSVFAGGERRVQLRGEAYFEVTANAAHPFIVEAGEVEILVTGTAFGVRAYSDEQSVRTVLESGSVSVSAEGQKSILQPDMFAVFDRQTKVISVGPADAGILLAWKSGRFAYDGSTLEEIFNDLGRWYDFTVTYDDEQSRHLRYSLDIRKHGSFADILKIIRATQKVDFEISGNNVTVRMKK